MFMPKPNLPLRASWRFSDFFIGDVEEVFGVGAGMLLAGKQSNKLNFLPCYCLEKLQYRCTLGSSSSP
jgi:hypothetical protein